MHADPLPAATLDRLVDASTDIDPFCSTSEWVLPAFSCWGAGTVSFDESGDAALALTEFRSQQGARIMAGLDPLWGFACPAVGPDIAEVCALMLAKLAATRGRWDAVLLSGLQPGSARDEALKRALGPRYDVHVGPAMTRRVACLDGDWEAYLGRRSARFRRNLRQAQTRADRAGLVFEAACGNGAALVERAVALERRSWKGRRGSGLSEEGFARFYRLVAARLDPPQRLRAVFARLGDIDAGYILGAVRGRHYRGFQLSYDDDLAALSIGNLLQVQQLRLLAAERIDRYDLGMDMAYKHAWSDAPSTTHTLVVLRR